MVAGAWRSDAVGRGITRGYIMTHSLHPAGLVLPFGALMGSIPIDSVQAGPVREDFIRVSSDPGHRSPEHFAAAYGGCSFSVDAALPPSLTPEEGRRHLIDLPRGGNGRDHAV